MADQRRAAWLAVFVIVWGAALHGPSGHAEVYQWRDAAGRVHFGDRKPADAAAATVEVPRVNSVAAVTVQARDVASSAVTLYSASWCGYCRKAREYFRQKSIPFEEYDVETSAKGRLDYAVMKGRGVPIILVGHHRMDGFDATRFAALYAP
jgi:glutaredoxin